MGKHKDTFTKNFLQIQTRDYQTILLTKEDQWPNKGQVGGDE